jgi:hypothetical protein
MEALEIESQTDQTPLAGSSRDPTQRELAEAEHLFDHPDHRFDGAFAGPVDRLAQGRFELVRHLDLGAGILGWRIRQRRETLRPSGMMWITTGRDVRLDAAFGASDQRCGTKIARLACRWGDWRGHIPR